MPKLYDLVHGLAGDKGDTSILSVIAHRAGDHPLLLERMRVLAVSRRLAGSCRESSVVSSTEPV